MQFQARRMIRSVLNPFVPQWQTVNDLGKEACVLVSSRSNIAPKYEVDTERRIQTSVGFVLEARVFL